MASWAWGRNDREPATWLAPPLAEGLLPVSVCGLCLLVGLAEQWAKACSRVSRGQTLAAAIAKAKTTKAKTAVWQSL